MKARNTFVSTQTHKTASSHFEMRKFPGISIARPSKWNLYACACAHTRSFSLLLRQFSIFFHRLQPESSVRSCRKNLNNMLAFILMLLILLSLFVFSLSSSLFRVFAIAAASARFRSSLRNYGRARAHTRSANLCMFVLRCFL